MILQRLKNLWAWSAYTPSNPPQEMGFTWTGYKEPVSQTAPMEPVQQFVDRSMSEIQQNQKRASIIPYKPKDPIQEFIGEETAI